MAPGGMLEVVGGDLAEIDVSVVRSAVELRFPCHGSGPSVERMYNSLLSLSLLASPSIVHREACGYVQSKPLSTEPAKSRI